MQDKAALQMAAFTPEGPANRTAFQLHWDRMLASESIITRSIAGDGELVGHNASWIQEGDREITDWISRNHWGPGIATEALRLFVSEIDTRPLYARAARDNIGSSECSRSAGSR